MKPTISIARNGTRFDLARISAESNGAAYFHGASSRHEALSPFEQFLVDSSFPVVYGLSKEVSDGPSQVMPGVSDIRGEFLIADGVAPSELSSIFVPREHRQIVSDLTRSVAPIKLESNGPSMRPGIAGFPERLPPPRATTSHALRSEPFRLGKPPSRVTPGMGAAP